MTRESLRLPELDGLRGLAALSVFFSHVLGFIPGNENFFVQRTPLHILWDGAAGVALFFVLSGYVLALPFVGTQQRRVQPISFIVKRIFRLYPAYWCALCFALLLRFWVLSHNHLGLFSSWANSLWTVPITTGLLVRQFLMVAPGINTHGIDPVIWTLVIEMKVSLIFPAVIFLIQRTTRAWYAVTILAGLVLVSPLLHSLDVLPVFVAGGYLAKYDATVRKWLAQRSLPFKVIVLLIALGIYGAPSILNASQFNSGFLTTNGFLITSVGAAILVVLVLGWRPLTSLTASRPVHFLGAVSYSFYLLHLPILLFVASTLYPYTHSVFLCMIVAFPFTLTLSKLSYTWIEMPTVRLGRNVARRMGTKHDVNSLQTSPIAAE
jgi:peptidoglycan/LPS O-acetylase OafA/YrhL